MNYICAVNSIIYPLKIKIMASAPQKKNGFFRSLLIILVTLITSVIVQQNPQIAPIVKAVGGAAVDVIKVVGGVNSSDSKQVFIDSVSTSSKKEVNADSILYKG